MKLDDLPAASLKPERPAAAAAVPPRVAPGLTPASLAAGAAKLDRAPSTAPLEDATPALAPALLELQAVALREPRFDTAATAVMLDLAQRLGASRVSLAVQRRQNQPARLLATSDGIDSDGRLQAMRALSDAADEAIERDGLVESPTPPGALGDPQAPAVPAVAHAALLRADEVRAVLGVAFDLDDGQRAAFLYELRSAPSEPVRAFARDAAMFVGPILMLKAQLDAPLRQRLSHWLRPINARTRQRMLPTPLLVGSLIAVGMFCAALWPSTHHVVAQARIEGHGQRVIPAPLDGFLQSVSVRPGETVKAGQVLATLDDREASLNAERTTAERAQHERQYLDALTREDAAATEIARAKYEQAKAQDELAQARLARSRLLAPFDGVLISGDLASAVGSPVKRGQELMVIAPSQAWRVIAEVDEHDVMLVEPGHKAWLLLAATASGSAAEFTIQRVSPVAQPMDGRNVFEAEGRLEANATGLRPGLRGIARIEAGERAPLAVWWERARNSLRRLMWNVMA